jgi:four helix bundle protein
MENKRIESYRDLVVWQMAHELVQKIFISLKKFPRSERAFMAQKMRDLAVQIPMNVAMGFQKRNRKTKVYFYRAALNVSEQLEYYLVLAQDLRYLKNSGELLEQLDNIEKKLKGLLRSVAGNEKP